MKERLPIVYIVFINDDVDSVHETPESAYNRKGQLESGYCPGFVEIVDFEVENFYLLEDI